MLKLHVTDLPKWVFFNFCSTIEMRDSWSEYCERRDRELAKFNVIIQMETMHLIFATEADYTFFVLRFS
jgi:hypothetical protein